MALPSGLVQFGSGYAQGSRVFGFGLRQCVDQ
jgi:hypothetical protein